MTSTVVDDPDELTDEWMSEALSRPTSVLSVEPVGAGQIGRVHRIGIRRAKETDGPASVIVKLAGGSREARHAAQRAFANEVGFYRRLTPTLRVRVPGCWFGAMSDVGF